MIICIDYGYIENITLAADPEYTPLTEASTKKSFKALRCRKCRRMLVGSENVVDHYSKKCILVLFWCDIFHFIHLITMNHKSRCNPTSTRTLITRPIIRA